MLTEFYTLEYNWLFYHASCYSNFFFFHSVLQTFQNNIVFTVYRLGLSVRGTYGLELFIMVTDCLRCVFLSPTYIWALALQPFAFVSEVSNRKYAH